MYTQKQAKKLGYSHTIDLRATLYQEYLNSKKTNMQKIKETLLKYIAISGIIWLILISLFGWGVLYPQTTNASSSEQKSIQKQIRLERIQVCQDAYAKSEIKMQFIYQQVPVARCATYMGLIYAYESNFGKSRRCIEDKNCFGMKGNGKEYPAGFIVFNNEQEGREYFAKKYFQWHYKKTIEQFVYGWSMTDRATYISFIRSRYWDMYREVEYLYMSGGQE